MPSEALKKILTVNDQVTDRAIAHAVFLERFKTGEVNQIVGFLNKEVFPDLLKQTEARLKKIAERGLDTGKATTKRLAELAAANKAVIRSGLNKASAKLRADLSDLVLSEADHQVRVLKGALPGLNVDLVTPAPDTLRSVISTKPMRGRLLKQWFSGLSGNTQRRVESAINIGIVQGESVSAIVARLRGTAARQFKDGILNITRREAESVVRTAVSHSTNHARELSYAANTDVIKAVQYVATLDSRTTDTCASLDGRVFPINQGPRPPMHFQCRSTTTPVLKSWKELGINLKEAPLGTRASLNGQVSGKLKYGDWLKRQPKEVQNAALGPGKARLFRAGKVPITKFVDSKFRSLTLTELEVQDAAVEFAVKAAPISFPPIEVPPKAIDDLLDKLAVTTGAARKPLQAEVKALAKANGLPPPRTGAYKPNAPDPRDFPSLGGAKTDQHKALLTQLQQTADPQARANLVESLRNLGFNGETRGWRPSSVTSKPVPLVKQPAAPKTESLFEIASDLPPGEPDSYWYHVTTRDRLPIILNEGLKPNRPPSVTGKSLLAKKWKGKVFFTDRDGAQYWAGRIYEEALSQKKRVHIAVVRIKKDKLSSLAKVFDDVDGTRDAGAKAVYVKKTIPAQTVSKPAIDPNVVDEWKKVGPQTGSNPGGLYEDTTGQRWYVKTPQSPTSPLGSVDRARNEVLAGKLYKLAGVEAAETKLVILDGKPSVASRWVKVSKNKAAITDTSSAIRGSVVEGFGTDAWLANWDVVGLEFDNLLVAEGKFGGLLKAGSAKAIRIDAGGSLLYRAQGAKKGAAFGNTVTEIGLLRNPSVNSQAAAVFGKMTDEELLASIKRVTAIKDDDVRKLVMQHGPGSAAERKALADKLIARKQSMLDQQANLESKIAAKKVAKTVDKAFDDLMDELANDPFQATDDFVAAKAKQAEKLLNGGKLSTVKQQQLIDAIIEYVDEGKLYEPTKTFGDKWVIKPKTAPPPSPATPTHYPIPVGKSVTVKSSIAQVAKAADLTLEEKVGLLLAKRAKTKSAKAIANINKKLTMLGYGESSTGGLSVTPPVKLTPAFQNAKSAEEIVRGLKANDFYRDTFVSLKGADLDSAKEVGQVLLDFAKNNPQLKGAITFVRMDDLAEGTIAAFRIEEVGFSGGLRLNRNLFSNHRKLKGAVKKVGGNGWLAGDSIEHVVAHETGHAVDMLRKSPSSPAHAYIRKNPPTGRQLSDYAIDRPVGSTTYKAETFAEAYAKVMTTPRDKLNPWLRGFADALAEGYEKAGLKVPPQLLGLQPAQGRAVHRAFFQTFSEWKASLKQQQIDTIRYWTGSGYIEIRRYQLGKFRSKFRSDSAARHIKLLDDALHRAPRHQGIMYRGITTRNGEVFGVPGAGRKTRLKPGMVFENNAYASYTTNLGKAQVFAGSNGTILKVKSKFGVNIKRMSQLRDEDEILAKARHRYRVTKVEKQKSTWGERTIVHAEEITPIEFATKVKPTVKSTLMEIVNATTIQTKTKVKLLQTKRAALAKRTSDSAKKGVKRIDNWLEKLGAGKPLSSKVKVKRPSKQQRIKELRLEMEEVTSMERLYDIEAELASLDHFVPDDKFHEMATRIEVGASAKTRNLSLKSGAKFEKEWMTSLSKEEFEAIKSWTDEGYRKIQHFQTTHKGSNKVKKQLAELDKALNRAPRKRGTYWRGVNLPRKQVANMFRKGMVWRLNSHQSFSTRRSIADFFTSGEDVRVMVKVKNGRTGVNLTPFDPDEAEVLMQRGRRLKVTSVKHGDFEVLVEVVEVR